MQHRIWALVSVCVIALIAILWQFSGQDKSPDRIKRIGVVRLTEVDNRTFEGFKEGMAKLGHVEGKTVQYLAVPPSGTLEVAQHQLTELLAQDVDALLVSSTPVTQLAKKLIQQRPVKLPVVFAPVNDPVAAGVVASLREPGGHLTGIRLPVGDKLRLQWLHELAPKVRWVLVPYTSTDQSAQTSLQQLREVAVSLNLRLIEWAMDESSNLAETVNQLPAADALFLPRDSRIEAQIDVWLDYANRRRLPLSAPSLLQVEQGALYSYGYLHHEIGQQAAHLMDQVLKGIPPGQLPVETADSFLGLNLTAAATIGLPLSDQVIRQARLVIRPPPP
ncbi:CD0873 family tyrosine ABC transporter substrate-binding lipoprotein [Rhodocyclaceae bacterium]